MKKKLPVSMELRGELNNIYGQVSFVSPNRKMFFNFTNNKVNAISVTRIQITISTSISVLFNISQNFLLN